MHVETATGGDREARANGGDPVPTLAGLEGAEVETDGTAGNGKGHKPSRRGVTVGSAASLPDTAGIAATPCSPACPAQKATTTMTTETNTCACGRPGLGTVFVEGLGRVPECGRCAEAAYAALPNRCTVEHPGEPCGLWRHLASKEDR
jgi:hypothetical protein